MEVILNLRPLHLEAEAKAFLSAGRLQRNGNWRRDEDDLSPTTARYIDEKIEKDHIYLQLPSVQDKRTYCRSFFECKIDSDARTTVLEVTPSDSNQIYVYTQMDPRTPTTE